MNPALHILFVLTLLNGLPQAVAASNKPITGRRSPRAAGAQAPLVADSVRAPDAGGPAPQGRAPGPPTGAAESPPAPLLVPGRPSPADTARRSRESLAREEYFRGRELERINASAAAILSYRFALHHDPQIADASYRMGMLYLEADQVDAAVKAFAAELRHHPDHLEAARQLGLGFSQLGQHPRAIAQLEALAARRPQDGESWRALGYAYMRAGRPRDAETALRRAIALPPASALEHRDLGYVLAQTEREDEARAEYRQAIALDPKETGARVNLANLDRKQGNFERALAGFREAALRDSSLALAVRGEALVLRQLGRDAEAAAAYRRLLELDPGDHASRLEAVQLHDALGRKDVALEVARDGVRYDGRSGEARLILGMALQAQGRTREAVLELRRAESLLGDAEGRARARRLIAAMRSGAPDSLRAQLEADSVALAKKRAPARPQGTAAPGSADSLGAPVPPDSR